MPSSRLDSRNFIGQSHIQKIERSVIVTSANVGRKEDTKAAGLKDPDKEMTMRGISPGIFPLLKSRLKGRCKV
jgi:hypothetical protein